jgi:hypothetical protein
LDYLVSALTVVKQVIQLVYQVQLKLPQATPMVPILVVTQEVVVVAMLEVPVVVVVVVIVALGLPAPVVLVVMMVLVLAQEWAAGNNKFWGDKI